MKVVRTLSPVRLVPEPRGRLPVEEYDAAKALFLGGEFQRAVVAFDSWLIHYPGNALEPAARYYQANAQVQARRPTGAMESYRRLIDLYPDSEWSAFARQDLADLEAGRRDVALARPRPRWWHPADWFTPDPPAVREFKRGRGLFDAGKHERALALFRTMAERHPDNPLAPAAWHYVGRCYERVGDIDQARAAFRRIATQYKGTHWERLAGEDYERLREE
jgi:TolA-binding protein